MTRYHVDTPAQLALVAIAIDQSLGLRNGAGAPTPREQLVYKAGVVAPASVHLGPAHQCYDRPGTKARLIDGGDGTAALEIGDDVPASALGKTVGGVPLPSAAALVVVNRARDNALLGTGGVRDKLDDAYVDSVFADATLNDGQRRAAVATELQNGSRSANALTRKDSRVGQQAIAQALGIKE
jgi:hypothetical protein